MGAEHYEPTAEGLLRLLERLRAPNGCPWDRAQTRETLGRSLAGETAELLDAIDRGDASAICDELGDVLMNALFQIVLAREKGEFTAEDVFGGVIAKMIRRHAHIFGDEKAETPEEVTAVWRKVKEAEQAGSAARSRFWIRSRIRFRRSTGRKSCRRERRKSGSTGVTRRESSPRSRRSWANSKRRWLPAGRRRSTRSWGDLLFAASNLARFRGADQ
ncbi:MAG: hypothetical protein L6W00_13875 [Lentisphaeria bacterium]|nr:MAG: hypothetical protein L6W00_13875 [Lentisphaeria bacterium]